MAKKKKRWPRNEAIYNEVQESEFLQFFDYLRYLTNYVCKGKKMKQIIQCLLIWRKFPNLSARRARGFLLLLKKFKIISLNIPCFKTLSNYNEKNSLQKILDNLLEESSRPLAVIENDFATDMTGIRTTLFSSWFSIRAKKETKRRDHVRDHITAGLKSMIVPAVDIRMKEGKDNIIMRKHVDIVSEDFSINDWLGDSKYWCKANCKKVNEAGAKPYFKCKEGKTGWNGTQSGVPAWKEMNEESEEHPRRYKKHYRKRVKIECTIHSKKSIHGDKVYSRSPSARINEETLRWINHNLNVLNRARVEWKIIPDFMV
jgi:transposase